MSREQRVPPRSGVNQWKPVEGDRLARARRKAMRRLFLRAVVATALIALGWGIGRAQTTTPDFELVIDAPAGETKIECQRGCDLTWVERGLNPNARPVPTFSFGCSGAGQVRCPSGRVGGWIKR